MKKVPMQKGDGLWQSAHQGKTEPLRQRLLFHSQHLYGIGHLTRSLAVADALARHFDVTLVYGGRIPSGIHLPETISYIQLPPIGYSDGPNAELISLDKRRTLLQAILQRRVVLQKTARKLKPEILLVEYFPFGRVKLLPELLPLLNTVKARNGKKSLVFCSVRDIVEPQFERQWFADLGCTIANHLYDGILVHGDPRFARFEETFKPSFPLVTPVYYTGFVARTFPEQRTPSAARRYLVVSAGGGRAGGALMQAAVAAYRLYHNQAPFDLLVITGPFLSEEEYRSLKKSATGLRGLRICRWKKDFRVILSQASGTVGQCGYNSVLDILSTGVPALVVPFTDGIDIEQVLRAKKLEKLGLVKVIDAQNLTPERLHESFASLLTFKPKKQAFDLDGADATARLLTQLSRKAVH